MTYASSLHYQRSSLKSPLTMNLMRAAEKYQLATDGFPARFVLAILASTGILYANLAPVIVTGLVQTSIGSSETAGYVFSSNMYGTAIGGFAITFIIRRIEWRRTAFILLLLLISADVLSTFANNITSLYVIRFLHGITGGALIGVGMSVISRIRRPEVTYSLLIFLQLSIGGAGIAFLMPLIPTLGMSIVWASLLSFSVIALLLIPLLDDYPIKTDSQETDEPTRRAPLLMIMLTFLGLFLYQAGEMAAFAYVIEIGIEQLLDPDFVNLSVAMSLWIGGPAALIVAWWSTRSGRLLPITVGAIFTMISITFLLAGESWTFMVANVGFGIFFSLTIPYLLGIASELDNSGELAAFAGFTSSLGLATGPAISATILREGELTQVIYLSMGILVLSIASILVPARYLDSKSTRGHIKW